jgi:hypothetical protein
MPNQDGSPTSEELAVARVRNMGTDFLGETTKVLKAGNEEFGEENFTRARTKLQQKLGAEGFNYLTAQAVQKKGSAHRLIAHLADNENDLEKLQGLPPARHGDYLRDLERDRLGVSTVPGGSVEKDSRGTPSKKSFFTMMDGLSDEEFDRGYRAHSRFGKSGNGRRR